MKQAVLAQSLPRSRFFVFFLLSDCLVLPQRRAPTECRPGRAVAAELLAASPSLPAHLQL